MNSDISWDPSRMEFKPVSMMVSHVGGMRFSAKTSTGLTIPVDAHVHLGGEGVIPNPIDYLFASLGGCIGIKILLDLKDKGFTPESLVIETKGIRKQDLPAIFETVHHIITLKGAFDFQIVAETLTRTMTLLCPVAVIFGSTTRMTWEHRISN
jgi:putative redox protein